LFPTNSLGHLLLLSDSSFNLSSSESLLFAVSSSSVEKDIVDGIDSSGGFCMGKGWGGKVKTRGRNVVSIETLEKVVWTHESIAP
jgi:hypothetical protein